MSRSYNRTGNVAPQHPHRSLLSKIFGAFAKSLLGIVIQNHSLLFMLLEPPDDLQHNGHHATACMFVLQNKKDVLKAHFPAEEYTFRLKTPYSRGRSQDSTENRREVPKANN